ncbi:hypothetical protein Q6348_01500 [Isoptericola sp. b441]|uniref:Uncharacterized protein n=1 Tax=Actinotalea lenta TaxID=3064654 RepID=A0ABT9D543_9CELL|nr:MULTISPECIES: hypothetical protein [unclassified Isoptericola]MDO8105869.1 hypothetical protein [Isoptericola sp. b441]MDO8122585.1 hypothetical protein [Isoptericola sp. b490]
MTVIAHPAEPAPHVGGRPRGRRGHGLGVTSAVAAALVLGSFGVAAWTSADARSAGATSSSVSEALAAAATAQETYHDRHGTFTRDVGALIGAGWEPVTDVDVVLLSAGTETFCLAAGPTGRAPAAWLSQDWQQLTRSCG